MVPQTYISHRSSGRVRLKVPTRKGDKEFFARLEKELSGLEGIISVTSNPLTASALILHSIDESRIAEFAREKQLFGLPETNGIKLHNPREMLSGIGNTYRSANKSFTELTGGRIDIPGAAFFALVAAGAYQLLVGSPATLPWYNAFWYALSIFLALKIMTEPKAIT
jgi:hypothetical protein